jgi:Undecaprenyl-phosphate glucose phosphotransferase
MRQIHPQNSSVIHSGENDDRDDRLRDRKFYSREIPAADGENTAPAVLYLESEKIRVQDLAADARLSRRMFNARTVPLMLIGTEFLLISGGLFAAAQLYHSLAFGQSSHFALYLTSCFALSFLFCLPCGFNRDHSIANIVQWQKQAQSVFLHWNSAYLIFSFILFISYMTDLYSRGTILIQYFIGLSVAASVRLGLGRLVAIGLKAKVFGGRKILIIGDNASVAFLTRRLHRLNPGIDLMGTVTFSPRNCSRQADPAAASYILKAKAAIAELARRRSIDEIVLALPYAEAPQVQRLIDELAVIPATVHLAPDVATPWTYQLPLAQVGSLPTLKLLRGPLTLRDRIVKRCFDLLIGSILTAVALPIFLIIALLIKLDSRGPVFFRQSRHGFNQDEFRIFKFRTMTTMEDGRAFTQATRGDTRVTRIGRFLRRTNIDELPQLFNVLLGHMSLVGPRPHAVAHNNEFEEKIRLYARRHNVKPGITGWSQINGLRGETDTLEKMQDRVRYDLYYIDNWSLLFDIVIMFSTIFSEKSYKNAY